MFPLFAAILLAFFALYTLPWVIAAFWLSSNSIILPAWAHGLLAAASVVGVTLLGGALAVLAVLNDPEKLRWLQDNPSSVLAHLQPEAWLTVIAAGTAVVLHVLRGPLQLEDVL